MSHMLIVHHDPVQRHFLATLLQHQGWEVVTSAEAEDACRVLQTQDGIDVLLIDLHLQGVSGWDFCRMLRRDYQARFSNIPFLCLSSSLSAIEGARVAAFLGAHAFMSLPVEPASLTQSLNQILEGKKLLAPYRVLMLGEEGKWSANLLQTFRGYGWSVGACQNLSEAAVSAVSERPDLMVCHYPVPEHTGLEWVADLKEHVPSARIFVVTGDHNPELAWESLKYGIDEFIREPVAPEYLDGLLDKAERTHVSDLFSGEGNSPFAQPRTGNEEFKKFLHALDEMVILTDGEGMIVDMNPHACRQLSWSVQELAGHSLMMLEPSVSVDWWGPDQNGGGSRETGFRTRDGSTLDVVVTAYPVSWSEGVRFVVVAKNVQEIHRLRAELQRLQAQVEQFKEIESVGKLAGGIAHDVNNILTAIQGHASLLAYKGHENAATQRPVEVIRQAAHRGQELTAQLLGAARRGKERRTSLNVHDAIEEVLALLDGDRTKGIRVVRAFKAQDPWINMNARQLHQVLLNLMVNACDAMPDGGTLTIATNSPRPQASVPVSGDSPCNFPLLEIVVTDSGCGISPELAETVFEPFFSTKPPSQGSGMGLAIVKEIVESNGGVVSLTNIPNQGASFHLVFPQRSNTPSGLIPFPTLLKKSHPKVLVVDDEGLVSDTTVAMLQHLACESYVANSGEEALSCYREHGEEIDAVLLDLTMATMGGEHCFRALRAINPSVKVIFSSGGELPYSMQRLVEEGVAGFVQKPFDLEDLSLAFTQVCLPVREGPEYEFSGSAAGTRESV